MKGIIKRILEAVIKRLIDIYRHNRRMHCEIEKFKDGRRKDIYQNVELTKEQERQIDTVFLNNYGRKIPNIWHRHYTAFTGKFDPLYFPELLYIPELEPRLNYDKSYVEVIADKNMLPIFCNAVGVKAPETYVSCANGIYRDGRMNIIRRENFIKACIEILDGKDCFAKPSKWACSGDGCVILHLRGGIDEVSGRRIDTILSDWGGDFVIQQRIKCSPDIRKLYGESVNTFRIMTYIWNEKIQVAPAIMRIGRDGAHVDNAHAGGIFIAINSDGTLHKTAFTEFKEEFLKHPNTNIVFEGYHIQHFSRVIEDAIKLHGIMPQIGVVHWDFTIDDTGIPVLIEANTDFGSIWLFQMAWGKGCFEENTDEMLRWLNKRNAGK